MHVCNPSCKHFSLQMQSHFGLSGFVSELDVMEVCVFCGLQVEQSAGGDRGASEEQ